VLSQIAGRPDGSEEGYRPAQEVFSQSHGSVWTMTPELRTEADNCQPHGLSNTYF
jgi:hypothetical protein